MATNFGTGSNRTIFSDGEGITSGDLNDISKNAIRRAWEVPGVAGLMAFDQVAATYADAFKSVSVIQGRNAGVFTIGGGLCPTSSAEISYMGYGPIAIWTEETAVTPPPATGDGLLLWGIVDSGFSVTHDNPATDLYRWDLITVSASEIDVEIVTRDYKDATTGAETSEDVVRAKKVQFAYTVTKGEEGATGAVAVPPRPGSSERYLYAAKVQYGESGPSVVELRDYTIPVGPLRSASQVASHAVDGLSGIAFDDVWTFLQDGTLQAASDVTAATACLSPPPEVCQPHVRILGVTLAYEINNSSGAGDPASVKLKRRTLDGSTADVEIQDIGTLFMTFDGAKRRAFMDLRGLPSASDFKPSLWGNGKTSKEMVSTSLAQTMPFIELKSPNRSGSKCLIYGITWHFVG